MTPWCFVKFYLRIYQAASPLTEMLSSKLRTLSLILILHCVMELNDVEIGRLMGMSKSAVQRHRTKTLKELRVKLMAIMPEGG